MRESFCTEPSALSSMINLSTGVRLEVLIAMKHGDSLKFNDDQMPTGRVVFGTFAKACEVAPPELSVEPTLIGTYRL
jgi:hypothetical protein